MKTKQTAAKTTHTPSLPKPHDGYYAGEELARYKNLASNLLVALKEIEDRCSSGEPFAGDEICDIATAAIAKATGDGR